MTWNIQQADAIEYLRSQPAGSVDLVFGSPPYEQARLYLENGQDMGIARDTETWVAWMVEVFKASLHACKGLVAFVVEGQTRQFSYSAGPMLLAADLCRAGITLRKPPIFHRVGIPGSGGPDWLRNDYEFVICATNGGKLPWSDNTACGHVPKWAPGGEMSYRNSAGTRRNQWGHSGTGEHAETRQDSTQGNAKRPSHVIGRNAHGVRTDKPVGTRNTGNKSESEAYRAKKMYARDQDGKRPDDEVYEPPVIANPGNKIDRTYTTEEVEDLLGEMHDLISLNVGGGAMAESGDMVHQNEAPFPEKLAEFFILSFCPPGGTVCDPFMGSGTTAAVAVRHGRNALGCDLRQSQVDLARKRIEQETPMSLLQ